MVSRFYVQNGKMLEAPNRRAAMEALKLGNFFSGTAAIPFPYFGFFRVPINQNIREVAFSLSNVNTDIVFRWLDIKLKKGSEVPAAVKVMIHELLGVPFATPSIQNGPICFLGLAKY